MIRGGEKGPCKNKLGWSVSRQRRLMFEDYKFIVEELLSRGAPFGAQAMGRNLRVLHFISTVSCRIFYGVCLPCFLSLGPFCRRVPYPDL